MNYKEFKKTCEEILNRTLDDSISVEWTTGGMCGGSCWNEGADHPVSAEAPRELTDLDIILEKLAPNLTFLQYKRIDRECTTEITGTHDDYYGNYTDYAKKTLSLIDLFNTLIDMDVL